MKLYHGSKNGNLTAINKMQASAKEGLTVPEDELKNGIYLTPDYGFALACAARPNGVTHIDDETKTIEFENPELFFPDKNVYVYEIEIDEKETRKIDSNQYIVENMAEIKPTAQYTHKAGDVEKYYEFKNWRREEKHEIKSEFKLR